MLSPIAVLILFLTIATPIAWFISEFRGSRPLRLVLGTLAILLSFGVAFLVGFAERFNSNAWFGGMTMELIDAAVAALDAGRKDDVAQALKELQARYQPTYENRARYDELVRETVERMKTASAIRPVP